jgi:hypothetical protein
MTFDDIIEFKKTYGDYLEKCIKKTANKKVFKVLKIKASVQFLTYFKNEN